VQDNSIVLPALSEGYDAINSSKRHSSASRVILDRTHYRTNYRCIIPGT